MTGHTIRSSNNAAAKGKKGKQSEFFASMETLPRTFFFLRGPGPTRSTLSPNTISAKIPSRSAFSFHIITTMKSWLQMRDRRGRGREGEEGLAVQSKYILVSSFLSLRLRTTYIVFRWPPTSIESIKILIIIRRKCPLLVAYTSFENKNFKNKYRVMNSFLQN